MISLKNISCKFEDKSILEDISLDIKNHLSVLGANGAGKSTLAKIICNLVEYGGEVFVNGQNIQDVSVKKRAELISYIPAKLESYDVFITLEEFVLMGRYIHKKALFSYSSSDKKIAYNCLETLNIAHLKEHTLDSLSSGETQLALIAQALTQESEIIIFDEPTANLDPKNSKIIAQHIKKLKENHQVILITHDIPLASFIDSSVAFIKDKKLHYFEGEFFTQEKLHEMYDVSFDALGVKYD